MRMHQARCCLPELLTYAVVNAGALAAIGAMTSSLTDVSLKTSVVYASVIGAVWPFIGKLSECCFDQDSRLAHTDFTCKSVAMLTSVYSTSSIVAFVFTQAIDTNFSPADAAKLSGVNLGGLIVVVGVTSLVSLCVVTQYLQWKARRAIRQPAILV